MKSVQLSWLNLLRGSSQTNPAHLIRLQIIDSCKTIAFPLMNSMISEQISKSLTQPNSSFSYIEIPCGVEVCSDLSTATIEAMDSLWMTRSRWCLRLSFLRMMQRKKQSRSVWAMRNQLKSLIQQLQVLKQLRVQRKLRTKLSKVLKLRCCVNNLASFRSKYYCNLQRFDLFFTSFHPPSTKNRQKSSIISSIRLWINTMSTFYGLRVPTQHKYSQMCSNFFTQFTQDICLGVKYDCCLKALYFYLRGGKREWWGF